MTTGNEIVTPAEYICPISLSVMKEPVMSKSGMCYERQAILDWLRRGHDSCPLTRQPLKPSMLIPNSALQVSIKRWRNDHDELDDDATCSSSDCSDVDERFVGLLSVDDRSDGAESVTEPTQDLLGTSDGHSDDDLRDLLDLYNEVLELSAGPFDPQSPETLSSAPTLEIDTSQRNPGVPSDSRRQRRWRPKFLRPKPSTS